MTTEIKVPALGESVTEATVAKWLKAAGDPVRVDDTLVELETDKITLEVYAQTTGTLSEIRAPKGATVAVGSVLGTIEERSAPGIEKPPARTVAVPKAAAPPGPAPSAAQPASQPAAPAPASPARASAAAQLLAPAVRKLVDEHRLNPSAIPATGKGGRLTKADVLAYIEARQQEMPGRSRAMAAPLQPVELQAPAARPQPAPAPSPSAPTGSGRPREERVAMTQLRKRIAERLKMAQNTAAMLTTFNEVDMTEVMAARNKVKEAFEKKHGVKLGFMSFFVKAAIIALKEIPAVNAQIDGDEIVYKNYYDIGVAVGTPQGLVVPVVRDADAMSFADLERKIAELGARARDGKLTMADLTGGTFTISNGGVYGSLMSTPILNPPQSGILGMHKIQERPIAVDGKMEIRPMMYLALSYDHRIIDGREAVTFLVRLKECIEEPQRILLGI